MLLAVVIVNFRTPSMTLDCLRSLAPQVECIPGTRVIVVDNGSGDGSVEIIRQEGDRLHWDWLEVLALPMNVGFAAGNNRGIARADDATHLLLLNSDTIVQAGCLPHCLEVMRTNPDIGAMSCMLVNQDGSHQAAARRFSPPLRQFVCALGLPWHLPRFFGWANPEDPRDSETPRRDVDWVCGAFMLCRADLIRSLGGLDEDFFFYGEDYELCHRIKSAGFRVHYDPRVQTVHLGGGSSDATRLPSLQKSRHQWRGRYLAHRKCHGRVAVAILRAMDLLNYSASAVVSRLRGGRQGQRYRESAQVLAVLTGRA